MRLAFCALFAGASVLAFSAQAVAAQDQDAPDSQTATATADDEEIIVTARRKNEDIQDVPLTVTAVTSENLAELNIRRFEDIQNIVPGLNIAGGANLAAGSATLRGVNFSTFASGNNGTVEFYLNDSPSIPQGVLGQMFDIGQIEVLRGPQGTLRGRASPSGSITVTTRRPDMDEYGGYVTATGTHKGDLNFNGAVNIPLISDFLALRVAALYDANAIDQVKSIKGSVGPEAKTAAQRITLRFEPTDNFLINATFLHVNSDVRSFTQVESANIAVPSLPASPVFITAKDRRSVEDGWSFSHLQRLNFNLQVQWSLYGQRLNYVASWDNQKSHSLGNADTGDFFQPSDGQFLNVGYGQIQDLLQPKVRSHELRLSSEEQIAGIFDYIVGVFYQQTIPTTIFRNATVFRNTINIPQLIFPPPGGILFTPIVRFSETKEWSFFGNVTAHIGDRTEISGGLRRIDYEAQGGILQNGVILAPASQDDQFKATIYMASIKHNFSDNLMVYAMTGSSWRPGITVIGDFSVNQSALEKSFLLLPPETSKSYEIGVKSSPLPGLRLNGTVFYQKFKNYPYRTGGVSYVSTSVPGPVETVTSFNFVGAVPVKVKGVEFEAAYEREFFDLSATAAYSKGKIQNGLIPCNDYNPRDGIPDVVPLTNLTPAQIRAATGGDNLSACRVNYRANNTPLFTASLQGEYRVPISDATNGFIRGQMSYFGNSQNDPTNAIDDIDAYALLNLYLGARGSDGSWEVALYAKNLTDTFRILTRGASQLSTAYRLNGAALNGVTSYRGVSVTAPREFGLNARFSFGSR